VTASCRICGRQCEASEDGRPLMATCPCVKTPLGSFLRYAIDTCVNPERESRGVERDDPEEYERDRRDVMAQDRDKEDRLGITAWLDGESKR